MSVKEEKSPDFLVNEKPEDFKSLILFNDDFNAFDYVIQCLVEVCEHDEMQAENCAMIAHYKGKCPVKNGSIDELKPKKEEMIRRKLTVEIQ
jgi:ATP-dependent Clp protease adaptor protein ClpS